jgi:hypothetical protein
MNAAIITLQTIFAAALGVVCFCRLVKTNSRTFSEVRLTIWLEFCTSSLLLVAPIMPLLEPRLFHWLMGTTPVEFWLAMLTAATLTRFATARAWRNGVPGGLIERRQP